MSAEAEPAGASREFRTGEDLFREGESGGVMFVIQQGHVRLWKTVDGEATTLAELGEGDFAGELPVVLGGVHHSTATATTATRCLEVDVSVLEEMVTSEAEIAVRFIRGLAVRLAHAEELLDVVGHRDSRLRVTMAILRHARASEERSEEGVWIGRRLSDIGDEVAVPRSELGEISKHFLRLQLLRVKRNGILVPDVDRLYGFLKSGEV